MGDIAEEKRISDRLVSLVDIVFGVVFGLSIPTIFGSNTILVIPRIEDVITISNLALIVAYLAIILSWIGYHKEMEQHPFKIDSGGSRRFFLDLAIVFFYAVLIYSRSNIPLYLIIFPIIFFLYFLWDISLNKEYQSKITSEWITLKYLIIFLIFCLIYPYIVSVRDVSWGFLILVLFLNYWFRHEKKAWHSISN